MAALENADALGNVDAQRGESGEPSGGEAVARSNTDLATAWRRRRARDRVAAIGLPVVIGVAFILFWQLKTSGPRSSVLIPSFTEFIRAIGSLLTQSAFWHAVWVSESALLVALAISIGVGIPFGLYVGRHPNLDAFTSGYLDIAIVSPTAVFMPLVIVFFGPTFWARVVVMIVFAFPYIALPCRVGAATVPPEMIEMSRSYGTSRFGTWRDVVVPASVPAVFTGLRQGVAHAFTGMFLIELTFLAVGIGYLLVGFEEDFHPAYVFGVSMLIVLEAAAVIGVLQYVQHRLSGKWRSGGRART